MKRTQANTPHLRFQTAGRLRHQAEIAYRGTVKAAAKAIAGPVLLFANRRALASPVRALATGVAGHVPASDEQQERWTAGGYPTCA